jgi:hypothetical protein
MEHSAGDFPQTATMDLIVTLICAVVVAVHAWDRYNTPASNRVSTTRAAFLFTGAGYVCGSLILFLFLSQVALQPDALPRGVLAVLEIEGIQAILNHYCAPQVLAVVVLTVLLPHHAGLKFGGRLAAQALSGLGEHTAGRKEPCGEAGAASYSSDAGRRHGIAAVDRGGRGASQRACENRQCRPARDLERPCHAHIAPVS